MSNSQNSLSNSGNSGNSLGISGGMKSTEKELRADVYSGLRDAALGDMDNNINLAEHGTQIILPSSFVGSERYMNQLFRDSMAICCAFNKPDIFLTMTANPNWPEIQDQLLWKFLLLTASIAEGESRKPLIVLTLLPVFLRKRRTLS